MKAACQQCGHIHSPDDAIALNRFSPSGPSAFIARHGAHPRPTRAEAEADECAWRIANSTPAPEVSDAPALPVIARPETATPPLPFPAAAMEIAARNKAWLDFLAQVQFSLMVWRIDPGIHGKIEHVIVWLSRCSDELGSIVSAFGKTNGAHP